MKRVIVTVVGGTILVIGLALLVLPGPAFLVIPLGLAVLATEYVWARRWLKRAKNMTNPRKAKRTGRALRQAFGRRWQRWRGRVEGWIRAWRRAPDAAPTAAPEEHDARTSGPDLGRPGEDRPPASGGPTSGGAT